jgi:hypothetical protein
MRLKLFCDSIVSILIAPPFWFISAEGGMGGMGGIGGMGCIAVLTQGGGGAASR